MSAPIRSSIRVGLLLGGRHALAARFSARLQLAAVAVTTYHLAVGVRRDGLWWCRAGPRAAPGSA